MTCIAGVVKNGVVYLGADSCGSDDSYNKTQRKDVKIFKRGEFVIGYTSSYRMGQIIQYDLKIPRIMKNEKDLQKWMVIKFIPALRKCLKKGGFAKTKEGEDTGGTFLIGFRGRLFCIEDDFQVGESADECNAVGCGDSYAKGSFYSTRTLPPGHRVKMALEAAAHCSGGVAPPFIQYDTRK